MIEDRGPEDPSGYTITYSDDGETFTVTRLADYEVVGTGYKTRAEAAASVASSD